LFLLDGGSVLPNDRLHKIIYTLPPFGIRKDKKSEFPDAACLFSLEDFARELPGKGILVSADKGWAAFAEESEHLYCVKTIEDLTKLFAATDEHGQAIKAHVTAAINDADSPLHEEIKTAIDVHLDAADWSVDEIYTSSVARVEGEAHSSTLVSYELDPASTSIWAVENEPTSWVVEVSALVKSKVQISATFFVWDSIDREELELTSAEIVVEHDAEIPIYLTCHGVHSGANPSDWDIEVEIGSGKYEVDVGEVDPDFSDDWHG